MSIVKFYKGKIADLPGGETGIDETNKNHIVDGNLYFTTDEDKIYIDFEETDEMTQEKVKKRSCISGGSAVKIVTWEKESEQ